MSSERFVELLFETLISGDREGTRGVIEQADAHGLGPAEFVQDIFWPTYETLSRLFKADQLSTLSHHTAMRLLRVMVDQNAARLHHGPKNGRTVFAVCGPSDADELGAQMAVDLLETAGFKVCFVGGGIANDEILGRLHEDQPSILLMFCSAPGDLPNLRQLVDTLREIAACNSMQIAVGGGVFNRADGLAEELGADLWGANPLEIVQRLIDEPAKRAAAGQRTVGRTKRRIAA